MNIGATVGQIKEYACPLINKYVQSCDFQKVLHQKS